tara:strand:- start:357 stop:500 length:144 start_codon:yes stop_codon:yes gene_type:complete
MAFMIKEPAIMHAPDLIHRICELNRPVLDVNGCIPMGYKPTIYIGKT